MAIDVAGIQRLSVPAGEFFDTEGIPLPIGRGAMNSVSSGPDDGAINKLAGMFWQPMRHATVQECRANLTLPRREHFPEPQPGQQERREQNVVGHGNTGYIETGDGQGWGGEYISNWNKPHWGWALALAGREWDGMLSFWSCCTGGGRSGAKLLFDVAKTTSRPVRGRTGLLIVYTQGSRRWVDFERNSTWQQAHPGMTEPPDPIDPPSRAPGLKLNQEEYSIIDYDAVIQVEVARRGQSGWVRKLFPGAEARVIGDALFHSVPIAREGELPGLVTVHARFEMRDGTHHVVTVIADRMADFPDAGVRFFTSPGFEDIIDGLMT